MADRNYLTSILVLLTVLNVCSAQVARGTILDVLAEKGMKTFASWCRETFPGLYGGSGKLTVFAFNDTTYSTMRSTERAKLMSMTLDEKTQYVQTYTLGREVLDSGLLDSSTMRSVNGKDLFINKRSRIYRKLGGQTGTIATFINGAMILGQERASNGIIHILDRPLGLISNDNVYQWLMNPDDPTVQTTIIKSLAERIYGEYFTSVISPISNNDRVTFFLPSENALRKIPASKLSGLGGRELANYFKMHYIKNRVVFTTYVEHQESYETAMVGSRVMFMRQDADRVLVKSGGVTAMIERGNITVRNGVIHIIDRMFGYVYNSAKEQISQDAPKFNSYIDRVSPNLQSLITQPSGVNMFIPSDAAFTAISNMRGANFDTNTSLIDYVVRLCMIKDGSIEVSQINGNYDVRQRRYTRYRDWKLVVYNDRNESWVNSGNVRARIMRPDVKVTTGVLQYIDGIPGVPSYDIPSLIYYDDYLIYAYNDLKSTGLVDYLKDQGFDSSYLPPRNFDQNGNGVNNFGQQNNYDMFSTAYPNQYSTLYKDQVTRYPNNLPDKVYQDRLQQQQQQSGNNNNQWGTNNNNQWGTNNNNNNNQWGTNNNNNNNQWGSNNNNQWGNNNNNQFNSNNNNQYGNNQYGNTGSSYYGTCGNALRPCQFTFFVPNGTAIYNYYQSSLGNTITRDLPRYRWVLRRLIIPNQLIFIEQMAISRNSIRLKAHNGDDVILRKESENTVRLSWGSMSARVIMSDLGATNGVVHIIDTVLSSLSDRTADISSCNIVSVNYYILGLIVSTLCYFQNVWKNS